MKDLHIVFGHTPLAIIQQSALFKPEDIDIIPFWDLLNIGPITDINDHYTIEQRTRWICSKYQFARFNEIDNIVEQDINNIKQIIGDIKLKRYQSVYLWSGKDAREIISTARIVYHLSFLNIPIFKTDFPNIPIIAKDGKTRYPNSLVETDSIHTQQIARHFKKLQQDEIQEQVQHWNRFVQSDSHLRFMHPDGTISMEQDLGYLDAFIFRHCTENFRSAALIIGHTLMDIGFNIGDLTLFQRVQELIHTGALKAEGDISRMGGLQLKLV